MIVAFSTSSPRSSVALFTSEGDLIGAAEKDAPMQASSACLELLHSLLSEKNLKLEEATGFLADLGPGSFTGVKVGVTLAKTFAFAQGCHCAGLPAFDLISLETIAVLPSKKGEFFVREPGKTPRTTTETPNSGEGYGNGFGERYPLAERFTEAWESLVWKTPEALIPEYLLEPSISQPKRAFGHA